MILLEKLTYLVNQLQKDNYPNLNCYEFYENSQYIATVSKESKNNLDCYNNLMYCNPDKYFTKINNIKILEPIHNNFVIVFDENTMYFVTI